MQQIFKSTGKLVIGLSLLILSAGVFSCNDDKKEEVKSVDSTGVTTTSTTTMSAADSLKMQAAKDSANAKDSGTKTDQNSPPPRN